MPCAIICFNNAMPCTVDFERDPLHPGKKGPERRPMHWPFRRIGRHDKSKGRGSTENTDTDRSLNSGVSDPSPTADDAERSGAPSRVRRKSINDLMPDGFGRRETPTEPRASETSSNPGSPMMRRSLSYLWDTRIPVRASEAEGNGISVGPSKMRRVSLLGLLRPPNRELNGKRNQTADGLRMSVLEAIGTAHAAQPTPLPPRRVLRQNMIDEERPMPMHDKP